MAWIPQALSWAFPSPCFYCKNGSIFPLSAMESLYSDYHRISFVIVHSPHSFHADPLHFPWFSVHWPGGLLGSTVSSFFPLLPLLFCGLCHFHLQFDPQLHLWLNHSTVLMNHSPLQIPVPILLSEWIIAVFLPFTVPEKALTKKWGLLPCFCL